MIGDSRAAYLSGSGSEALVGLQSACWLPSPEGLTGAGASWCRGRKLHPCRSLSVGDLLPGLPNRSDPGGSQAEAPKYVVTVDSLFAVFSLYLPICLCWMWLSKLICRNNFNSLLLIIEIMPYYWFSSSEAQILFCNWDILSEFIQYFSISFLLV